jgi:hypothetical protein
MDTRRLESVGGRLCQDLSASFLGGGGSKWLSVSDASQSSGAAQFPNLFEAVLCQIDALPLPRQRRTAMALSD